MATLLETLLGQTQRNGARPPAAAVEAPSENEIAVEDRPYRKPKGGFFSLEGTGGQVLGTIGDALLVGSGRDAIYRPRRMDARARDAMIDYTADPERALNQLSQVPGMSDKAAELWDKHQERTAQVGLQEAQALNERDEYEGITHQRAAGYLGAATPTTYPAIRQMINKWYADRGVDPPFELPEVYDAEAIASLARGAIAPDKQASLSEAERYHKAQEVIDSRAEFGRNWREAYGNRTAMRLNDDDNKTSERNTDVRAAATSGNRPANLPKIVKTPDGRVIVR